MWIPSTTRAEPAISWLIKTWASFRPGSPPGHADLNFVFPTTISQHQLRACFLLLHMLETNGKKWTGEIPLVRERKATKFTGCCKWSEAKQMFQADPVANFQALCFESGKTDQGAVVNGLIISFPSGHQRAKHIEYSLTSNLFFFFYLANQRAALICPYRVLLIPARGFYKAITCL